MERLAAHIDRLAGRSRSSAALDATAARLTEFIGAVVRPSDAASSDAVQLALNAVQAQERSALAWQRTWAANLRSEMLETTDGLASALKGNRTLLIWGTAPPLGFSVDLGDALSTLPRLVGPEPGVPVSERFGDELLLLGENGKSGLHLLCRPSQSGDQYDLRAWGRYARTLVTEVE